MENNVNNFVQLVGAITNVAATFSLLGVTTYTGVTVYQRNIVPSPSPVDSAKLPPFIRQDVVDGEVTIIVQPSNLYDANIFASENGVYLHDESIVNRSGTHQTITAMLQSRAYWFFDEVNATRFIWTSCYIENAKLPPSEVLLYFQNKTVTTNASTVDVWCEPWDELFHRTTAGASEPKIPVVIQVSFNVTRAVYEHEQVTSCLTLQPVNNGSALGHVGYFKPKKVFERKPRTIEPQTSFTSPMIPTTTKPSPPIFFHNSSDYIEKYPSVSYDGDFFVLKVFDEPETYYGAENICDQLSNTLGTRTYTLIERIAQTPSYFGKLSQELASGDSSLVLKNLINSSYLIWTGAYFDLSSSTPDVLLLPNGERRLDVSVLSDDLCDESKNFADIIGRMKLKNDDTQKLHVVMKYMKGTPVCLKLLEEGSSYTPLLPACQYNYEPPLSMMNVVFFPKLTNVSVSLPLSTQLCKGALEQEIPYPGVLFSTDTKVSIGLPLGKKIINGTLKQQVPYRGVLFSADMVVSHDELNMVFLNQPYRSATVWTGAYFDLKINETSGFAKVKPQDVLVFENRDGTFTYRDPSSLRWCDGQTSYVQTISQLMNQIATKGYYDKFYRLTVPVKINSLKGPGQFCFQPHTDDVYWPGRGVGIAACNLEQKPSIHFNNDTYYYQFVRSNNISNLINSTYDYVHKVCHEKCSGPVYFSYYVFTIYRLSLEQSNAIVCKDFFGSKLPHSMNRDSLPVVSRKVHEYISSKWPNYYSKWNNTQFWSGFFFDVDEIIRNKIVQPRIFDNNDAIDLNHFNKLWCDRFTDEQVQTTVNNIVGDYIKYFDAKGYRPSGPKRIQVAMVMNLSSEATLPCLELKPRDLYWPGSIALSGLCKSRTEFTKA